MPAPNKADVSLLRLAYTTSSFCKHHAVNDISTDGTYKGLAVVSNIAIKTVNQEAQKLPNPLSILVAGTPMDENKDYYPDEKAAYTDAIGLPMHADLLYSRVRTAIKGSPDTQIQQIAREILKYANFHLDNHPSSQDWEDGELGII